MPILKLSVYNNRLCLQGEPYFPTHEVDSQLHDPHAPALISIDSKKRPHWLERSNPKPHIENLPKQTASDSRFLSTPSLSTWSAIRLGKLPLVLH